MRKYLLILLLVFTFSLFACGKTEEQPNNPTVETPKEEVKTEVTDEREEIYLLAVESGYKGTYEEWLASIKGDEIVLQVSNGYIQWKYASSTIWTNLVSLAELTGSNGSDGKSVEMRFSDNFIQWKYVDEAENSWKNLLNLSTLTGINGTDGKTPELRVNDGYIEWRYQGDNEWKQLLQLSSLNGTDGLTPEFKATETHLLWKYTIESDSEWKELLSLDSLKGEDGAPGEDGVDGLPGEDGKPGTDGLDGQTPEFRIHEGYLEWKYTDSETWTKLFALSDLEGSDGVDGKPGEDGKPGADGLDGQTPEFRIHEGYLEWKYADSETWTKLFALSDLEGSDGVDGKPGEDGKPGADGLDGQTPEFRIHEGYLEWKYTNSETWIKLFALSDLEGSDGVDGKPGNDGLSAYELYCKYHPEYKGTEEEWINEILLGNSSNNTEKQYTVTFDSNGGSIVEDQVLTGPSKIIKPENPTKTGYTFDGWYVDGEKWSFIGYTVLEDVTLQARWVPNTYKITYKIDGFVYRTQDVSFNTEFELVYHPEDYHCTNWTYNGNIYDLHTSYIYEYDYDITFECSKIAYWGIGMSFNINGDSAILSEIYEYNIFEDGTFLIPEKVYFDDKIYTITEIASHAIKNTYYLTIENLVIPKTIEKIGYTFSPYIQHPTINNCYYEGTQEEWFDILFERGLHSSPVDDAGNFYVYDAEGSYVFGNKTYSVITDVVLEEETLVISEQMFYGHKYLTNIEIPKSVNKIETEAFLGCYNLSNIYYNGTYEEWLEIEIAEHSTPIDYNTKLYVLDENGEYEYNNKRYSLVPEDLITNQIDGYYLGNINSEGNYQDDSKLTEISLDELSEEMKSSLLDKEILGIYKIENIEFNSHLNDGYNMFYPVIINGEEVYVSYYYNLWFMHKQYDAAYGVSSYGILGDSSTIQNLTPSSLHLSEEQNSSLTVIGGAGLYTIYLVEYEDDFVYGSVRHAVGVVKSLELEEKEPEAITSYISQLAYEDLGNSGKMFHVTGKWISDFENIADNIYGQGYLCDEAGNNIYIGGLSSKKESVRYFNSAYFYNNLEDFPSLGIEDDSVIEIAVFYSYANNCYYGYFLEKIVETVEILEYDGKEISFNLNVASAWHGLEKGIYSVSNEGITKVIYNKRENPWTPLELNVKGQFGNFTTLKFGMEFSEGVTYIVQVINQDGVGKEINCVGTGQYDGSYYLDLSDLTVEERDSICKVRIFVAWDIEFASGEFKIHWMAFTDFEDRNDTETESEPTPVDTTVSKLFNNKPETSMDVIYIVEGIWKTSEISYNVQRGEGYLLDENGNYIYIYGLSSSKDACLTFENGVYKYTNSKDFESTGLETGSIVKIGVVYNGDHQNYSAYLIEITGKIEFEDVIHTASNVTKVTSLDQLTDGAKILVAYRTFLMGALDGTIYTSVELTQVEVTEEVEVITLVKSGDNWLLQLENGKYVSYSGSGNSATESEIADDASLWTITITDGIVSIANVSLPERLFQYNSSSPRFVCYKGTQINPTLYVVTE